MRAGIKRALAKLPPVLREAFVMHYVDGIPYETMASLLGASVSALKMRAQRARQALSAALRENNVTGEPPDSSLYQVR
jgi:RNA polymerase sigma-70 factor (ECF subfamily)